MKTSEQIHEANRLLKLASEFQSYSKIPPKSWYRDLALYLAKYEHDKYPRIHDDNRL